MENIIDELTWRGLIKDSTDIDKLKKATEKDIVLYCGYDPTADSLHVGHLLPLITMMRFKKAGHEPYNLIGNHTAGIGDPSGRSADRPVLTPADIASNTNALCNQLYSLTVNNGLACPNTVQTWYESMRISHMLKEYAPHLNVSTMLSKDSISNRLSAGALSLAEFNYMLFQAVDFYKMHVENDCVLQIGGSDQWGNITAGIELIHKKGTLIEVHGLTLPLLLNENGTKFGKTEGGAVWLDGNKTSPYQFYQFWMNVPDKEVFNYMRMFCFLDANQIDMFEHSTASDDAKYFAAKHQLALEVTALVHGIHEASQCQYVSMELFKKSRIPDEKEFVIFKNRLPVVQVTEEQFKDTTRSLEWAVEQLLVVYDERLTSRSEARRRIQGGGVYVNHEKARTVEKAKYSLLNVGKKFAVIELAPNP